MRHCMRPVKRGVSQRVLFETHGQRQMLTYREVKSEPVVNTTQKRIKILEDDEIAAIYSRPQFTDEEKESYFDLSQAEKELLLFFRSARSQIYFILQLGYFKAKHLFFSFDFHEVRQDVEYIRTQYFPDAIVDEFSAVDKRTRRRQRRMIEKLFDYHSCRKEQRQKLAAKAKTAVSVFSKPIYVFRELMQYLEAQRIVAPGYSFMQDTVSRALSFEQDRLMTIVSNQVTSSEIEALKRLLSDPVGLYEITRIKREPKDFSLKEIEKEISRGQQIHHLYGLAKRVMPTLNISNESIKYYASLVGYYSVFRLRQLTEQMVYIYLLCFVYHRYQRCNDNLIQSHISNVRRFQDEAKEAAKERVYQYRIEVNDDLQKASDVLKLFTDDTIADETPFSFVQTQAFSILSRDRLSFVADRIAGEVKFDETAFAWEHISLLSHQFKRHLRPILRNVNFTATKGDGPLIAAIDFLKTAFEKGKPLSQYAPEIFPMEFVPLNVRRYLYTSDIEGNKRLLVDRYEFLVYRLLRNGLEAGDIFCRDSVRFQSFDDDLIDNKLWQQEKERLIALTGLSILQRPIEAHLAFLQQRLESRIAQVNRRITDGLNEQIQIKSQGQSRTWTLSPSRGREDVNHPFFDALSQADIGAVMQFVNQQTGFRSAFSHVLGRYAKQNVDNHALIGSLVAWGTNTGLGRMGEISDIGYQALKTTSDNFIRLETLGEANDSVSNATAQLDIFRHQDIGEVLHSSSDGQKFETRIPTINARYSPKYFGLKKGVVSYTLVANHVPVNAKIIGANDHESHYVFDILFNNTTDIQPEVHSTDTHGTNEVNFALLHLFGYQFAPRYRDVREKICESFYGFSHPSKYGDLLIKPIRKIKNNLIEKEWDNIGRIAVSLALKTTTQSIIVSKLSAYARKNRTRRALWEYDNIIRSLYLLDYVDSPPLRQNVFRALNRGENYHQLRRAISYANEGKLRFKNEHEQQIWNECARLIANCIIYYNATLLSTLKQHMERNGDPRAASLVNQISLVAWQHVNLHGRFEFASGLQPVNINGILELLNLKDLASLLNLSSVTP